MSAPNVEQGVSPARDRSSHDVGQGFSPALDRPLNILQVCDHLGWDGSRMHGVKRLFAWMIPRFDPARFKVSLVSLRTRDVSEETLDSLGIDIQYLHRGKFDPATLTALLKIIDHKRIDVLHLHGYGATTFGRLAGAMRGIPTILHEHANLTDTPWFQKVADRLLEPYTDIAIGVSESTAEFVRTARLVRPERVKVVYLGAPLEEFGRVRPPGEVAAARAELGIAPGEFAVGTITRLHGSKGNEYLVEAAATVVRERPAARFFVVGEGPLMPDLQAQAAALGLGDRLVFAGFAKDVARVLSAFDLSVFPSLWEGTPLTVFETLAMGKPIVATDVDGLRDVLAADRNARIVPARDAAALAREIVWMIDHPADRERLGAAAREAGREYRHRRVRPQDAAAVRAAARRVAAHEAAGRPRRRPVVPRRRGGPVTTAPAAPAAHAPMQAGPGLLAALVVFAVYGGLALTVDFPAAAKGIQSDEATYYLMGRSLAEDGDLTYRKDDLERVWGEFPSGPAGVFLKKGRDIKGVELTSSIPFVGIRSGPDRDAGRLFYGKSFSYPVLAAPFVVLLGTNGFLLLNAILLAVAVLCGYLFLHARMPAAASAVLASAFVLATVVPVYFVWITPELFNFALGLASAYFCWLYKEVATPDRAPRGTRWLLAWRSDVLAAVLLGIATFSKPSNLLLFAPIVAWQLWRREWRRAAATLVVFLAVAAGLFGVNLAISGEWNYQGGERNTFYVGVPVPGADVRPSTSAHRKARDEALTEILFDPEVFWTNLTSNLGYSSSAATPDWSPTSSRPCSRSGASSWHLGGVPAGSTFVLAAGLTQILFFVISLPYTWFGGGGSVGNRYFMGAYGVFLFMLPAIQATWVSLVPWAIGSLFTAQLVLNPFMASFRPGDYAKHGPLRWLPVELTNVNDLPINTDPSRVRVWFGDNPGVGDPGFQVYFLDDNAYGREEDKSFWVKGRTRAEFLIKTDRPIRRAVLTLTAGPVATDAALSIGGRRETLHLAAGESQQVTLALGPAFPYQRRFVWVGAIASSTGFAPIFHDPASTDSRYLGVRVKPVLVP